jgi:hypothetical protein
MNHQKESSNPYENPYEMPNFSTTRRVCSALTLQTRAAAYSVTGASGRSWSRAAQAVQETTGEAPGLAGFL